MKQWKQSKNFEWETLQEADVFVVLNQERSSIIWHLKLNHMSEHGLKILSKRKLLLLLKSVNLSFYEHYVTSKQHRMKSSRSNAKFDLVPSDIWE